MQTELARHSSKGTIGFHSEQDKFAETLRVSEANFLVLLHTDDTSGKIGICIFIPKRVRLYKLQ